MSTPPNYGTATITIPVTTFNLLSTGQQCVIGTMTAAAAGDPRVTINAATNTIVVKPVAGVTTALNLAFNLSGLNSSYNIAGIIFTGANSSNIFNNQKGDGTGTVTVTDALATVGTWELIVIVQQGSGGNIGLIDPPIENDAE